MAHSNDPRRRLPAVDKLLRHPTLHKAKDEVSAEVTVTCIRNVLLKLRMEIEAGNPQVSLAEDKIVPMVLEQLIPFRRPSVLRVINATGVILHTGLGRAPLAESVLEAARDAGGYCNLEFDLENGERGDRQSHVESLLCYLTGAESALVVNNNAAGLYLVLNVFGYRREVVVSRGQLIEIGGSFRLPEIMARTGARLVEVGTTNRTRITDYKNAINSKTALLLRCHTSNYRIIGFTETVALEKLVKLGRAHNIPVIDDIGNGLLWDWSSYGLPAECNASSSLETGADIVLMSGDKALGGPQAGIILGRQDLILTLKKSPLARVLRPEKLMLAGLSATLRLYLNRREVPTRIPVWEMLTRPVQLMRSRAERIYQQLLPLCEWHVLEIRDSEAETGSGTLPAVTIPSIALCLLPRKRTAAYWAKRLRATQIPVIGTIKQNVVWLDMRTIFEHDEGDLVQSVQEALKEAE